MDQQSSSNTFESSSLQSSGTPLHDHPPSSPIRSNLPSTSSSHLSVYSWGRGEDGQLGVGDTSDQSLPILVSTFLTSPSPPQTISCGSGHTVVLSTSGHIYTWGRGDDGRLGHGDNGWKYIPRLVQTLKETVVVKVTCGSYHTAAVTQEGRLFTWGGGMYGKLGHGTEAGCSRPKVVEALDGVRVREVACGSRHTCAVVEGGEVWTWGDKENGVSGHGDTEGHQYTPRVLASLRNVVVVGVSACGFHSAVVDRDGGIWTWGEGKFGRLGHGSERNVTSPKRVEALNGERPFKVACGGFHTAAVTEDGAVYTWGGGEHGQLGHGDKVNKTVPTLITSLDYAVTQITCGWSHSVALSGCGKVFTWGNGDHGKLGHGNSSKVATPKQVEALAHLRVVKIASYNEHTAALTAGVGGSQGGEYATVSTEYASQFKGIVGEEDFSDVTFMVGGRPIHAHKAILACRCPHFRAMFTSGMRESVEREIVVPDTDHSVFLALMEFLYTDSVEGLQPDMAVDLHGVASFYGVDKLKDICAAIVKKEIDAENAAGLLQRAHDALCSELKEIAMEYVISKFDIVSKGEGVSNLSHQLLLEILSARP
ncbi:hypothetical protein TrST_g897 [Triparma strigata]|uniref:BTB domain-containing protein n=1 Tax=Triparma strigata TaxID=1606541 RepID=A0A9W7EGP6_9STRA|nr:hypothetical protein TrST_g897 [Triparma strigata]